MLHGEVSMLANLPLVMGEKLLMAPLAASARCSWGWKCRRDIGLNVNHGLPSGKLLHNYGKSPLFMGKSAINDHFQ